MVNVTKEQQGDALLIKMTGSIEESVDFEKLIGPPPKKLIVSTKGVPRINSVGVKAWIKYFSNAASKGTEITLIECSMAIVEQINLISNFSAGGKVESVYAPYLCADCGADYVVMFKTEDLKKLNLQLPTMACTKCQKKNVQFDDVPEDYFYFMQN